MEESPLIDDPKPVNQTVPSGLKKMNPAFHLLVPATKSNPNLCKLLLSSFVLSYPTPTLINYGKDFNSSGKDNGFGSHTGKIQGVYDFLNDKAHVKDDDLVLIVDGYDVWMQLPPDVLIKRYHKLLSEADERLRRRYGMETRASVAEGGAMERVPKYTQKVVFAADKICWPNPENDPACAAVPYSTLPKDAYGPETDQDKEHFLHRPRYLNSGTVIGPAADLRAIYESALARTETQGWIGDQYIFSSLFGEQEFLRETLRQSNQGAGGRWLDWISSTLGAPDSPLAANRTINNVTIVAGQNYEYGIALDYESELFQTVTRSMPDLSFVAFDNSSILSEIQNTHPNLRPIPFNLPIDLQTAKEPYSYSSADGAREEITDNIMLPFSPKLDSILEEPPWDAVPLATNIVSAAVPALLHFNGDGKPLRDDWWSRMWYALDSRALLRRYMRSSQGARAAAAASAGGQSWWDMRGGRGGVWTDNKLWMSWGEVCKATEDIVFADGQGTWGSEEGPRQEVNMFGKTMIAGEDVKYNHNQ